MKITERSGVAEVAASVGDALGKAGIRAVLTGGACASIYTAGLYQSSDLDFVIQGGARQVELELAMASVGFQRQGDRYVHPLARFYVEFPPGPLAIGADYGIEPIELPLRRGKIRTLSATDSCRDRLAAFLHWKDPQNLRTAVTIALRNSVDLEAIRSWSVGEGAKEGFERFLQELERVRIRKASRGRASDVR